MRCPGLSERPHEPTWRVGLVVGVTVRRVQPDGAVRRDEDAVHVVAVRGVFLLEVMTRAVAFDAHDTRCHLFRYEAGGDVLLGLCAACDRSSHQDGYEDGDRQRVLPHHAPLRDSVVRSLAARGMDPLSVAIRTSLSTAARYS